MLRGAHFLIYSADADADRRFLDEILGLRSVDAHGGWLIFQLPPSEVAVHPMAGESPPPPGEVMTSVLYWMCDSLSDTMNELGAKGVRFTGITEERWGKRTTMVLPSGGELGLYQPYHALAIDLP